MKKNPQFSNWRGNSFKDIRKVLFESFFVSKFDIFYSKGKNRFNSIIYNGIRRKKYSNK